jgi:putative addiction module component (TIGR02574 family)
MKRDIIEDALALSPSDRLALIAALWDSLDDNQTTTPDQIAELRRRVASFDKDRADVLSWEEFKAELEAAEA